MGSVSRGIDRIDVTFDEPNLVANAGLLLVATLVVRLRYLSVPGRLVNTSGTPTLRAPLEWPWAKKFKRALDCLRALPPVPV